MYRRLIQMPSIILQLRVDCCCCCSTNTPYRASSICIPNEPNVFIYLDTNARHDRFYDNYSLSFTVFLAIFQASQRRFVFELRTKQSMYTILTSLVQMLIKYAIQRPRCCASIPFSFLASAPHSRSERGALRSLTIIISTLKNIIL